MCWLARKTNKYTAHHVTLHAPVWHIVGDLEVMAVYDYTNDTLVINTCRWKLETWKINTAIFFVIRPKIWHFMFYY